MTTGGDKYAKADMDMPPLHKDDDPQLNLREIFLMARERGYQKPAPHVIHQIRQNGYDHTLLMQVANGMGKGNFLTLMEEGDLDLSAEYAVWKHLINRLDSGKQAELNKLARDLNFK